MRLEPRQQAREVVGLARVEARFGATAAVVVLTDEDLVLEDHLVPGGRVDLERHVGEELTLVVAVEVDLEHAVDMRLVVRIVVEGDAVDLDGAVVPRRPAGLRARLPGDARDQADGSDHHAHETAQRAPLPAVVCFFHYARLPFSHGGSDAPAFPSTTQPRRLHRLRRMTAPSQTGHGIAPRRSNLQR
ncbi:MAG TPA: hypothetical protein VFM27_06090 [Acidimicrobiales bacterium]|nr:hypothetical protein [Acidimicrobiales bacterium]